MDYMFRCPGRVRHALASLLVVVTVGFGPRAVTAQSDYEVMAVSDGATLSGRVVFHGDVPPARRLLVTKDEEVCGFGYIERHEVAVGAEGALEGAVVYIERITRGKEWVDQSRRVVDQKDCSFQPNMLVAPRWAEMDIVNSDPVLHNIHAWELMADRGRTLFNLGQPPEKEVITQPLRPRRGNHIRLECDAHDFMQGWIFAADSPYAVATGDDGIFVLEDVPPGEYTIKVWHPFLGMAEQVVTLSPGQMSDLGFDLTGGMAGPEEAGPGPA